MVHSMDLVHVGTLRISQRWPALIELFSVTKTFHNASNLRQQIHVFTVLSKVAYSLLNGNDWFIRLGVFVIRWLKWED